MVKRDWPKIGQLIFRFHSTSKSDPYFLGCVLSRLEMVFQYRHNSKIAQFCATRVKHLTNRRISIIFVI